MTPLSQRLLLQLKHSLWNAIQIALALYGIVTIGYLLARWLTHETWPWVAFASSFVPWWALGGGIAAGLALFSRRRWWLIALQLPILITFGVWYGDMLWPPQFHEAHANHPPNTIELTAATFNIRASHSDPARIVEAITALDADIVGLQELNAYHEIVLFEALTDDYQYRYHFSPDVHRTMNVGILSRYPLVATEVYTSYTNYGRHLRALVDVEGIMISIYLEHPNSPDHAFSPFSYDTWLHDLKVTDLADEIETDSHPILVLCDCNMTDQTAMYHRLNGLLHDSFRETGWGLGFTFPANPIFGGLVTIPALRIDYIWHSDHFIATDAYVADDNGTSDHFPVVAKLVLQKDRVTE